MKALLTKFDRLMAAITFAEANAPELSEEFSAPYTAGRKMKKTAPRAAASEKRTHAGVH